MAMPLSHLDIQSQLRALLAVDSSLDTSPGRALRVLVSTDLSGFADGVDDLIFRLFDVPGHEGSATAISGAETLHQTFNPDSLPITDAYFFWVNRTLTAILTEAAEEGEGSIKDQLRETVLAIRQERGVETDPAAWAVAFDQAWDNWLKCEVVRALFFHMAGTVAPKVGDETLPSPTVLNALTQHTIRALEAAGDSLDNLSERVGEILAAKYNDFKNQMIGGRIFYVGYAVFLNLFDIEDLDDLPEDMFTRPVEDQVALVLNVFAAKPDLSWTGAELEAFKEYMRQQQISKAIAGGARPFQFADAIVAHLASMEMSPGFKSVVLPAVLDTVRSQHSVHTEVAALFDGLAASPASLAQSAEVLNPFLGQRGDARPKYEAFFRVQLMADPRFKDRVEFADGTFKMTTLVVVVERAETATTASVFGAAVTPPDAAVEMGLDEAETKAIVMPIIESFSADVETRGRAERRVEMLNDLLSRFKGMDRVMVESVVARGLRDSGLGRFARMKDGALTMRETLRVIERENPEVLNTQLELAEAEKDRLKDIMHEEALEDIQTDMDIVNAPRLEAVRAVLKTRSAVQKNIDRRAPAGVVQASGARHTDACRALL